MTTMDQQFQMLRGRETRERLVMDRVRQDVAQRALNTMRRVSGVDPDQYGEAERVSEETGIPAPALMESADAMFARKHEQAMERALSRSSRVANWVAEDPGNAVYAQHELEVLAEYGALAEQLEEPEQGPFSRGVDAAGMSLAQAYDGLRAFGTADFVLRAQAQEALYDEIDALDDPTPEQVRFLIGQRLGDLGPVGQSFAWHYANASDAERESLRAVARQEVTSNEELLLELTRAIIARQAEMPEGEEFTLENLGPWAANVAGQGGPYLLGLMAIGALGGIPAAAGAGGAVALGGTTSEALVEGEDILDSTFRGRALVAAFASGGLEVGLGPVARVVRGIPDDLVREAAESLLRSTGREVASNSLEEAGQELMQTMLQDWAIHGRLDMTEEGLLRYLEAAAAGALLGGPTGGALELARGTAQRVREGRAIEADSGERAAERIESINQQVTNTRLRDRSPRRWRRFLQRQGFEQRNLYIDPEPLVEFVGTAPEALQALGLSQTAVDSAAETGALIPVNLGTYMTNVPGRLPELEQLFVEHGRTSPSSESRASAQVIKDVELAERQAEGESYAERANFQQDIFDEVLTRVSGQLRAAGQTQQQARANASLTASFFSTLAARTGDTEAAERFRFSILGPGTDAETRQQATSGDGRLLPQGEAAAAVEEAPEPPAPAPQLPPPLPGMEDIMDMVQQPELDPQAIMATPQVQAVLDDMASRPETIQTVDLSDADAYSTRAYRTTDGRDIAGVDALFTEMEALSARFAGGEVRQERRIDILLGPPAAGKSTIAEQFIAPEAGARIVDSDDIKKMIPEFDGGIGAAAVHEESSILSKQYLAEAMARGDNIVLPKVGDKAASIEATIQMAREAGYTVNLVNMAVDAIEPFRRNMTRFAVTGRLVPPEYVLSVGDKPTQVYEQLKETADGYASYDNNVPFGQDPVLTEDSREGSGDDAGRGQDGGADSAGPDADQRAGAAEQGGEPSADSSAGEGQPARFRVLKQQAGRRQPENVGRETGVAMPTNLAAASELALNSRFRTGRDFKVALQDVARAEHGESLLELTDENLAKIADFIVEDALEAVQDNQNAIGWYDDAVTRAKTELAKIYPEIAEGGVEEFAFIWALAVTSNGLKVDKNFELAAQVYDEWKQTGRFPKKAGIGQASAAINSGLQMFHTLLDKFDGDWEQARDFMITELPVREIEGTSGFKISGEGKGEVVRGSAILGPKIGNGFFSNLYGYFDGLTMDRWLMRSVGRWRGSLISINEEMIAKKRQEIRDLAELMTDEELEFVNGFFNGAAVQLGRSMDDQQLDQLAEEGAKRSMVPEWRGRMNEAAGGKGDTLRKVLNGLARYLDGQVEQPGGTKERSFIRGAFRAALERLQQEPGMEQLTMADLQALLWYPEKLLYETAKKPAGEEVRTYEDDEAPDYGNAARNLVRNRLGRDGDGGQRAADVAGSGEPEGGAARRLAQPAEGTGGAVRADDGGTTSFRGRSAEYAARYDVGGRAVYEVTDPALFGDLINEAKAALGPLGAQVTAYDDYAGRRLFLFDNGASGFALDGDDIISVFSSPDSASGVVNTVLDLAVQEGGRRLDAFNTFLPRIYAKKGFRAVARLPFNREFAPEGWDYGYFEEAFGTGEPDVAFMVYDPENATADTDNVVAEYDDGLAAQQENLPRELAQSDRGQILIPAEGVANAQTVIELFQNADASTYLHEAGHYFLEIMQSVAAQDGAPQSIRDDMATVNKWLGRAEDDASPFTTEQQEAWAEAFENYLYEGRAPSPSLKAVFSKFASWLGEVYRRLMRPGTQPSPEIREVMDRMLATDEEIATVKGQRDSRAMFAEIPPGMSQEEWAPYVKLVEREEAETRGRALERAMAKIRRRRTEEWKKREDELRPIIAERLRQEQAYRAIELLGGLGPDAAGITGRLDKKMLVDMFGEQILQDLTKERHGTRTNLYTTQGTDPRFVAETLGYPHVVAMINDIRSKPPMQQEIERQLREQLGAELGDPADDVSIREEAEAALKNGFTTERVSRELAAIERSRAPAGSAGPNRWQQQNTAAKDEAESRILRMPVREVMAYRQFMRNSQKLAREAQRNLSKVVRDADGRPTSGTRKFLDAAADAKRKQLLNDHMYRIARDKASRYAAARRRFQRLQKKSIQQKIGADFMDAINGMLEKYSFRDIPIKEVRRRIELRQLYEMMLQEGRGTEIAFDIDVISNIRQMNYTELTADELDGVIAAIDNLAHMGRATTKQLAEQEKRDRALILDEIADRADKNLKRKPIARERRRRPNSLYRQFQLHVLNADSLLRDIDGEETALGPAYNAVKRAIDRGVGRADDRRQEAAQAIRDIYVRNLGKPSKIAKMGNDVRVYQGIEEHGPLSRLALLSLALNSGNEGNWERATAEGGKNTYDARRLSQVLVSELTENEWRFVQEIWDYLDSYWPEISEQERKYTGVTPKKVKPRIMVEGAPAFVRGGYYPIRYDHGLSNVADDIERANMLMEGRSGVFAKAQTATGHTNERTGHTGMPLDLDLSIIQSHVFNVIHDLELRAPVRDAGMIIYSERFKDIMLEHGRGEDLPALKSWLEDVALGDRVAAYGASRWFRWMRGGFTLSAIGFKASTILLQAFGVTQSMVQVGYTDFLRGYTGYLKNTREVIRFARENSHIMSERIRTFDKDISQITADITASDPAAAGYQRILNAYIPWAYVGMQIMQFYVVDVPTWYASHEKALRKGESPEDAIVIADRDVRIAQGSGLMSDRGMLERGRLSPTGQPTEWARLFTVLGSYMFGKFNLAYRRVHGTDMRNPAAVMKLTMDLMMLFVVEAFLVYLLRNGWPDEDDEDSQYDHWYTAAAGEGLFTAMGTMPVLRDVSSTLQGWGGGSSYAEYVGGAGNLLRGAGGAVGDLGAGELLTRQNAEGLLGFGGTAFFLPSGQLNDLLDAIFTNDWDVEDEWLLNTLSSLTGLPLGGEDES